MPFARALALRYRGSSELDEDLVQVASLGLIKAFDGFDLERGEAFKAYAAPTILGELDVTSATVCGRFDCRAA